MLKAINWDNVPRSHYRPSFITSPDNKFPTNGFPLPLEGGTRRREVRVLLQLFQKKILLRPLTTRAFKTCRSLRSTHFMKSMMLPRATFGHWIYLFCNFIATLLFSISRCSTSSGGRKVLIDFWESFGWALGASNNNHTKIKQANRDTWNKSIQSWNDIIYYHQKWQFTLE